MEDTILKPILSKAQLAKQLGVSRTYITLLLQGKRTPSQQLANKLRQLAVDQYVAGRVLSYACWS